MTAQGGGTSTGNKGLYYLEDKHLKKKNTFLPPSSSSSSSLRILPPSTRYIKVARYQLSSASRIVVSQNVAYCSRQAKIIEPAMKGEDTIARKQS